MLVVDAGVGNHGVDTVEVEHMGEIFTTKLRVVGQNDNAASRLREGGLDSSLFEVGRGKTTLSGNAVDAEERHVDGDLLELGVGPRANGCERAVTHVTSEQVKFNVRSRREQSRNRDRVRHDGEFDVGGEKFGQTYCGCSTIECNRAAVREFREGGLGDPLLLRGIDRFAIGDRGLYTEALRRNRATVCTLHETATFHDGEVTTNGFGSDVELVGKGLHIDATGRTRDNQDGLVALWCVHVNLSVRRKAGVCFCLFVYVYFRFCLFVNLTLGYSENPKSLVLRANGHTQRRRGRVTDMSELTGIGVGRGVAAGPVLRMPEPLTEPADRERTEDAEHEITRATEALAVVREWLAARGEKAGGDAQAVLEAQSLMAGDPALAKDVAKRIHAGKTAERAVFDAFGAFQKLLEGMGGYMGERAADLADVAQRVIAEIRGVPAPGVPESDQPFILVAHDLAPADTALLDFTKVFALVTRDGGPTSHTAILARAKSIPAIVGVTGADKLADGTQVVVDAGSSTVTVDATPDQIADALVRREAWLSASNAPITDGALKDGHKVPLLANLGSPKEAAEAVKLGAEGVGLFRTEFLFLDSATAPTVEQQEKQYVELLEAFPHKKVVVRALDAGADKPLAFLNNAHEENPALGLRGLRALRVKENILRDQIQALVNAQNKTDAELWVMAPMVSDAEETDYFVGLAKDMGLRIAGVMAEVPSLALVADQVLETADFVSIGTNDLTQYTMAADRMLGTVASFQDPWHPAVLRLIERLGAAGDAAGKPVGVCGEAAADPNLAIVLVGLGVTTLSMTPAALSDVRAALLEVTLDEAKARAARALTGRTAAESRKLGTD